MHSHPIGHTFIKSSAKSHVVQVRNQGLSQYKIILERSRFFSEPKRLISNQVDMSGNRLHKHRRRENCIKKTNRSYFSQTLLTRKLHQQNNSNSSQISEILENYKNKKTYITQNHYISQKHYIVGPFTVPHKHHTLINNPIKQLIFLAKVPHQEMTQIKQIKFPAKLIHQEMT